MNMCNLRLEYPSSNGALTDLNPNDRLCHHPYLITLKVTVSYGEVAHVRPPLVEVHRAAAAGLVVDKPAAVNFRSGQKEAHSCFTVSRMPCFLCTCCDVHCAATASLVVNKPAAAKIRKQRS
jgi:hypothetical protein